MSAELVIKQAKIHGVLSLETLVNDFSEVLKSRKYPNAPVGILADNSSDWIALDLATQHLDITLIPIPHFFSHEQKQYFLKQTIISSGKCGYECALSVGRWNELHNAKQLSDADFEDLLQGQLDFIKVMAFIKGKEK